MWSESSLLKIKYEHKETDYNLYLQHDGNDDSKMMESVKQLLSEKFEIKESVTEQFIKSIYIDVYKGDYEHMYSHKQAIINTINEITFGKGI